MSLYFFEIAQEPARQIDEMNPLVDQFATSGKFRHGTPFLVIAKPAAMSVTGPHEHHFTQRAAVKNLASSTQGAVIPVVEADAHARTGAIGCGAHSIELRGAARSRLFNQDVL